MKKNSKRTKSWFCLIAIILSTLFIPLHSGATQKFVYPPVREFPLPDSLSLCGEAIPLEKRHVLEMLDREFTIIVWDRAQVFMWLKRVGRYLPFVEKKLAESGLPQDLKYVAVAESSLLPHIRSRKGALGPWQFMSRTARHNGLRKDRMMDERRDFERSTEAALRYLSRLKETFGSWTLALAAYNCGESRLRKAMKVQEIEDFYRLTLPRETERYIFRIAAIKIILSNPHRYGYRLPGQRVYKPVECDRIPVKLGETVHITKVAKGLGTDYKTIKDLNPQILGHYLPTGRYTLKVPAGLGTKLAEVLKRVPKTASRKGRKTSKGVYIVKPGDTLSRISKVTGVSITRLRRLNNIKGSLIKAGQRLRLVP